MNRVMLWVCVLAVALSPAASAWAIGTPKLKWTHTKTTGSNHYYLNGNVDNGGVLDGQIGYGARWIDTYGYQRQHLSTTSFFTTGTKGAKATVRLGDYYFVASADKDGIGRFNAIDNVADNTFDAWSTASLVGPLNPPGIGLGGTESIVTDGTLLYMNDDSVQNAIHAYSVVNTGSDFTLTREWTAMLPAGGRVRGLYCHAASGYLYMHNGGDGADGNNADNKIYAISTGAEGGTVTEVGTHDSGKEYQVIRAKRQLLVAGTDGKVTVYKMTSNTSIEPTPEASYDLELGAIYGLAVIDGTLMVTSSGGKISAFDISSADDR
ncbi:MAG: hypothetical protein U9N87_08920 [Planctomycetota bacterium]|nr:hypothetical protein [Planctomycetota bacterium]